MIAAVGLRATWAETLRYAEQATGHFGITYRSVRPWSRQWPGSPAPAGGQRLYVCAPPPMICNSLPRLLEAAMRRAA